MTTTQAKARLDELFTNKTRAERRKITPAEWDEIARCEDVIYAAVPKRKLGYFPACFAGADWNTV